MCTAVSYNSYDHYFGRNLDWEHSFGENIIIVPRNFEFCFKSENTIKNHYAILGVGIIKNDYPLYFDAVNEFGLCIAGLNFPDNATYFSHSDTKTNVTPYEFIPFVLSKCKTVHEAIEIIKNINFLNIAFSSDLPLSPLHWIISDHTVSITVEPIKSGVKIYNNPVGVLTNNPTFDIQLHNLNNYINISPYEPKDRFAKSITLSTYSRGMGAIGLPGDLSSQSRFVRATFVKSNIITDNQSESVSSFFHILSSVEMQKGCVITADKKAEHTIFSDCYDTQKGIIYFKTYNNANLLQFCMHNYNLEQNNLIMIKSDP